MHEAAVEGEQGLTEISNRNQNDGVKKIAKIIDVIQQKRAINKKFFSMEVSPKSNFHLNYKKHFDTIESPIFTSITWHTDLDKTNILDTPAYKLSQAITETETVMLHMNCEKITETHVETICRSGINNVLVVRGDTVYDGQKFKNASNLVQSIRTHSKNMCIAVGGYPEIHPESISSESDLNYLKEKVECGADFIITQVCFSSTKILQFIRNCRQIGIVVPIIPGVFIPRNYRLLTTMCRICKIRLDDEKHDILKAARDDNVEFLKLAETMTVVMVRELFENVEAEIEGVHFFTLNNLDSVENVAKIFDFC